MNTAASAYPNLVNAISNNRVCYIFGAGMSKSLSSDAVGWIEWLHRGASMLEGHTELKMTFENGFTGDYGAQSLVTLAGKVIAATKAEGVYGKWMAECIVRPAIDNPGLARILGKIPAAHDLMATTNYDSLLEQAAGIGATSWSNPGETFTMIDKGASDKVIHLHGAFEPKAALDDIVADESQYAELYDAEGAQLVQNLIGVRPIVFVGCGATTEDPNISRLLRFVSEELDVNVPYFYLCRTGDAPSALPPNVEPIEYGSEYSDLTPFLDELFSRKIARMSQTSPLTGRIASWACEKGAQEQDSGLGAYHFANDQTPFFGREAEIGALRSMLRSDVQFGWTCITGQGGSGKSRIAYELLKSTCCEWLGFFLSELASRSDAASYEPMADTIVVVDYALGRESEIAGIIQALHARFTATHFRLRFILLERDSSRDQFSWYGKLRSAMGGFFASSFESMEFEEAIDLQDLDDESVAAIIAETCRQCGLPPDSRRDAELRESYRENFETLAFRPLFVCMFTQAWVKSGRTKPLYTSFASVLEETLQREQEKWLALFDNDQKTCNSMLRLIVRACAGGPLRFCDLPDEYAADWGIVKDHVASHAFPGKQRDRLLEALVSLSCHDIGDSTSVIAPSFPCVIREYMLVYYVPEDERDEFARELWRNAGREFSQVLVRGLHDFRDDEALVTMLKAAPDPYSNPDVLLARMSIIEGPPSLSSSLSGKSLALADKEYAFWHEMPIEDDVADERKMVLNLLKFNGLVFVGKRYGMHSLEKQDMDKMMACFREASELPLGVFGSVRVSILSDLANALATNSADDMALQVVAMARNAPDERAFDADGQSVDFQACQDIIATNILVMKDLVQGKTYDALERAKRMRQHVDVSDDEQARLFARTCLNVVMFALYCDHGKDMARARAYLDGVAAECPNNETVRAMSLTAEAYYWTRELLSGHGGDDATSRLHAILAECDGLPQNDETFDCWASAAIGLLNTPLDEREFADLLRSAELKLDAGKVENTTLAQAWMKIKVASRKGKGPIPLEDVQKAHAYFLRFPESESTRDAFVELLDKSVERNNKDSYFDARARTAMVQDMLTNPMVGIDEDDLPNWLFDDEPIVVGDKPGRNDPCPCGSGKKFKKCCIGKGIYD